MTRHDGTLHIDGMTAGELIRHELAEDVRTLNAMARAIRARDRRALRTPAELDAEYDAQVRELIDAMVDLDVSPTDLDDAVTASHEHEGWNTVALDDLCSSSVHVLRATAPPTWALALSAEDLNDWREVFEIQGEYSAWPRPSRWVRWSNSWYVFQWRRGWRLRDLWDRVRDWR